MSYEGEGVTIDARWSGRVGTNVCSGGVGAGWEDPVGSAAPLTLRLQLTRG